MKCLPSPRALRQPPAKVCFRPERDMRLNELVPCYTRSTPAVGFHSPPPPESTSVQPINLPRRVGSRREMKTAPRRSTAWPLPCRRARSTCSCVLTRTSRSELEGGMKEKDACEGGGGWIRHNTSLYHTGFVCMLTGSVGGMSFWYAGASKYPKPLAYV